MKEYPSIPSSLGQSFREFDAHVFDKLDGSNLRFEWSKKAGWYKQGTRSRLFDETDEVFGSALSTFHDLLAAPLADIAKKERWEAVVVFCEFWGPGSFAGLHDPTQKQTLTLFDVAPYKQGFVGPREFLKLFKDLPIPGYLGQHRWTRQFVQDVRDGKLAGVTFEGVVGKSQQARHDRITAKAKTQAWVDAVRSRYSEAEAEKILQS